MNAYVASAAKSKLTQKRGSKLYGCTDIDPFIGFLCELEVFREKPINAPLSVHSYIRSIAAEIMQARAPKGGEKAVSAARLASLQHDSRTLCRKTTV